MCLQLFAKWIHSAHLKLSQLLWQQQKMGQSLNFFNCKSLDGITCVPVPIQVWHLHWTNIQICKKLGPQKFWMIVSNCNFHLSPFFRQFCQLQEKKKKESRNICTSSHSSSSFQLGKILSTFRNFNFCSNETRGHAIFPFKGLNQCFPWSISSTFYSHVFCTKNAKILLPKPKSKNRKAARSTLVWITRT